MGEELTSIKQEIVPIQPRAHAEAQFVDEALLLTDAPVPGRRLRPPTERRAPAQEVEAEVVTSWERLAALQAEWRDLAKSAVEPNPFYEPWMLLPALKHLGAGRRLEVCLVFEKKAKGVHRLCGLFPVERKRGRAELWVHRYCYLGAPLLRRGCERAAISCWLDTLREPVVRLDDLPAGGALRMHLVDELSERGWASLVSAAWTRAVLRRAPTAEHYLASALQGTRRKEFRRQRKRLAEQGELACEELPAGADPSAFIDEFLQLEQAGWKGRDGVCGARDRGFLQEMAAQAAHAGRLQLLALRLSGKPVALKVNLLSGTSAFAFKITFDEAFSRYSPGVQLELENIERAHKQPGLLTMDSCAASNRFMINHLWPDRREIQTVFFSTGSRLGELQIALVPLIHLARRLLRRA